MVVFTVGTFIASVATAWIGRWKMKKSIFLRDLVVGNHQQQVIVQDGLAVINDVLFKIRETVKYVKGSMARKLTLAECIEGNSEVVLSLDVQTIWNSTYLMLRKAYKYQRAFSRFKVVDTNYKYCPSCEEWKMTNL